MDDNFIIILGNGFTKGVLAWINNAIPINANSSNPFSFDISYLNNPDISLMSKLPKLQLLISQHTSMDDFDLMRWFTENQKSDLITYAQMRQYLAIVYSKISKIISKNWQRDFMWENWFKKYQNNIKAIISFNYDLSIETLLLKNNIDYYRVSTEEDTSTSEGISIFKPHGSCDYECPDGSFSIDDLDTRLTGSIFHSDSGIPKILSVKEQMEPRITPDIIVPFENNFQIDFRWVTRGYSQIVEKMRESDSCILYGLDYHKVDRPEINYLISNMPRSSRFIYSSSKSKIVLENEIRKRSRVVSRIDYRIKEDFDKLHCKHRYQIIIRKKKYTTMKCELCGKLVKHWN